MDEACSTHSRDEKWIHNFSTKPLKERQLGKPRHRGEDDIKMDLK